MGLTASVPVHATKNEPPRGTGSLEEEETSTTGVTASVPIYAIEAVPGKGKGLIATKDIPKGTRTISEKPIITVGRSIANAEQLQITIYQQVSSLSSEQICEFLSMANVYPHTNSAERYTGIFQTNALPMGKDLAAAGVFLKACRINHACDNNAQNFWNENLERLTVHAVKDILIGEEITMSYLGSSRNRRLRQEELQAKFKFTCCCRLCSLPPQQSRESDLKLDRIHLLDCIIEHEGLQGLIAFPKHMLAYIDEQVRFWNEPTPHTVGLARAYPDAFQIAIANGYLARARTFAERVLDLYLITGGADSPDVIEYRRLVQDPTTHKYYGMSMAWKKTLDEIPQGLGVKEFENWLWKR